MKRFILFFYFTVWIFGIYQCVYYQQHHIARLFWLQVIFLLTVFWVQTWIFDIIALPHSVHFTLYWEMSSSSWNDMHVVRTISNCAKVCLTSHKIAILWFSSEHQLSPLGTLGLCQSAADVAEELECISDNLWFPPGDSPIWPKSAYFLTQTGDFAGNSHRRFYYL